MNSKEKQQCVEGLTYYDEEISGIISETEELKNEGTYIDFTVLSHYLLADNADQEFGEISQKKFKAILGDNVLLSIALARHFPEYYIPNFFAMQFYYLKKIAKKYEFDLPNIPIRSDYKGRWLYYNEMCKILNEFAIENDIQSLSELCTFLYGYEVSKINEEMAVEHDKPMPKIPEQAWILVGNYGDGEKTMKEGVWQSNQFTCKGDIMLFYEKSPVKKLNAVWTALEDGFIDPFGPYYSYSIIGNKIEIPNEQAITFKDFKDCEYFKKENRGPEGNFVSKNFQDVSGWSVTSSDYKEIKRLLEAKGFDTSLLPSLYEPKGLSSLDVFNEEDVYNKLLTPLLEEMGWKKGKDFIQEVEFAAGHTTTKHPSNKRPDYCLHPYRIDNKIYSKVVIEAKYFIKSIEELEATFDQCLSYASWGKARVIVLCDKTKILVYEQDRNGLFHKDHHHEPFRWENMKNLEKFNELKRMLDI